MNVLRHTDDQKESVALVIDEQYVQWLTVMNFDQFKGISSYAKKRLVQATVERVLRNHYEGLEKSNPVGKR
jgi:hypothetical protein